MLRRVDLRGVVDPTPSAAADRDLLSRLPRPGAGGDSPVAIVAGICDEVQAGGDGAVRAITRRVDGCELREIVVPAADRRRALEALDPDLRGALELAAGRIAAFQRSQMPAEGTHAGEGVTIRGLVRPVDRAGAYVPGGAVPLLSSVLMTVVPAREAGVREVVVATAPGADGAPAPGIVAAAELVGATEVVVGNGVAVIAALAYGTESIPAVDVIVGPGGTYTSQAKREVAARGLVGVPASFAGPSEVAVVADESAPVDLAATDLIVQVEHGPDGLAWLICWSEEVADSVEAAIERLASDAERSEVIRANLERNCFTALVDGPRQAIAVANAIAPEHLQLMVEDPGSLLSEVRHAGAVFCGPQAGASFGDYLAGPSHVLPTFGSARYGEALGVRDFLRTIHAVEVSTEAFERLGPVAARLARAEGLGVHTRSLTDRSIGDG